MIRCSAEGIEHGLLESAKSSRVTIGETDRLSDMVEDLLYLSPMDSITQPTHFLKWDLRELLSKAAERQRGLASERNVHFVIDFGEEPAAMWCDDNSLTRAFSNTVRVRFRTRIKDPMDLVFLFWSIGAGIALGAGLIPLAALGSIAICILLMAFVRRTPVESP